LEHYLEKATTKVCKAKAIIAPHAGYRFSGPTAGFAYKMIDPDAFDTIVLLGPSHKVWLESCAVSKCDLYQTPLGSITIDTQTINELKSTKLYSEMDVKVDENEHSLEMHLPFLYKVMSQKSNGIWKLIPIMVGQLDLDVEAKIAQSLQRLFNNPSVLFVISSDFCHWGSRFRFDPYENDKPIHSFIEELDRKGMSLIEQLDHYQFSKYLKSTGNTICGRNPILLLLKIIEIAQKDGLKCKMEFVEYQQSSRVTLPNDSSVSYASACLYCL
jgi:AmmeMemoRadiSam system protein B